MQSCYDRPIKMPDTLPNNEKVLHLVHDLGDCTDSRGVLRAATERFADLFGDYAVFGFLMSDSHLEHWMVLPLQNPRRPVFGAVDPDELTEKTDSDSLAQIHGRDVTAFLASNHKLRSVVEEPEIVFVASQDDDEELYADVQSILPVPVPTVLVGTWRRPSGGIGAILLGFTKQIDAEPMMPLFKMAVKLTSRLAFYPAFSSFIEKLEKVSHSLRRNLVHDLKTPATVIQGYAETLMMPEVGEDPALRQELLQGIREQAERLLEDLRDILHPLDAHWKPQKEAFDLALLLQKAVTSEKHTTRAADHEFRLLGVEGELMVSADKRKIRRVIENLLSNAVKYSPGQNKTVTVSLELANDEARITFKDEGIGMTPDQLDKALSGGVRVVDATLGIEGSGFGLDSCRRILDAHGGKLDASSSPGLGSRFTAVLPLSGDDEPNLRWPGSG